MYMRQTTRDICTATLDGSLSSLYIHTRILVLGLRCNTNPHVLYVPEYTQITLAPRAFDLKSDHAIAIMISLTLF